MKIIDVLDVGTEVQIGEGVKAHITAIGIRGREHYLSYEVAWWDGRSRKVDNVPADMVVVKDFSQRVVGLSLNVVTSADLGPHTSSARRPDSGD